MKFANKKFFLATFATLILSNFSCLKVMAANDVLVLDESYKNSKNLSANQLASKGLMSFLDDVYNKQIEVYCGKFSKISGGITLRGDVFNNKISVYGGNLKNVYGGISDTGSVFGNTINIYDGIFTGEIVGGKITNPQANSQVKNNVINIYGGNFNKASLTGGIFGNDYSAAGNFLNINVTGLRIREINFDSFEKVVFYLPENVKDGETILSLGGRKLDSDKISFATAGNVKLQPGKKINLVIEQVENLEDLNQNSPSSSDVNSVAEGENISPEKSSAPIKTYLTYGSTLNYEVNLNENSDGSITATVGNFIGQTANPISQSNNTDFIKAIIPELDPFSDIMTDAELYKKKFADDEKIFTAENFSEPNEYEFFFNRGNKNVTTKSSGGSISASQESYNLGFARSFKTNAGKIYVAPVYESASGNYSATLSNNILGSGKIKYSAGGIIARMMRENGFYCEGSFRTGRTENNFSSNDFIVSGLPTYVTYSMEAPIFTGHLRVGNAFKIDENNFLDLYGIYFSTHQRGKTATLSTGEDVNFNSSTAHTFRLGYRLTTRTSLVSKIYSGFAWQYEKNSDSIATASNYLQKSDGAKGSSAMIEFGWQIKPNKFTTWTLDLNATAWAGRQQGFNFLMQAQKSF